VTPAEIVALAAIVFVAFTIHAVTGFASMIAALAVGGLFFDLAVIRPPLVALNVVLNLWFVMSYRGDLAWRVLLRHVLPWMGAGVLVGFQLSDAVQGPLLRRAFGVFVVAVAGRELYRASQAARYSAAAGELSDRPPTPWLVAAGLIHGIYATGGPPLVYALSKVELNKSQLRATLCAIWVVLNVGLTVGYLVRGEIGGDGWVTAVAMVPAMVAAIAAGSWIHGRIDARRFRVAVYVVLIVAAVGLVVRP